ncbi:MAG: VOC family protein [Anaerolineae bacterium]
MQALINTVTVYVSLPREARAWWVDKIGFVVKSEVNRSEAESWITVGLTDAGFTSRRERARLQYRNC